MSERLLLCTDLDRTVIPNGVEPESPAARYHLSVLVSHPAVTLAYVSGRHRALVEEAMVHDRLPVPDFVIGDVGSTIYRVGPEQEWALQQSWEARIGRDWAGKTHADLIQILKGVVGLRLQEPAKQNRYKLSYYFPLQSDRDALSAVIGHRLQAAGVKARLIWSVDERAGTGLLDVLPERVSKFHAVEALMESEGFDCGNTVFCGDSGNDLEVLASPIPAVLVANSTSDVRQAACRLSLKMGHNQTLYIARGGFMGMNGNYSAGVLEGVAHYHPETLDWMGFSGQEQRS